MRVDTYLWFCTLLSVSLGFSATAWSYSMLSTIHCVIGSFQILVLLSSSVVLRFSKMKTVTNLYILNLAFADEFFLIGVPILIYTMHLGEWIFGDYLCKLYMISTSITQFTSSIFLVIMSADRSDTHFNHSSNGE